MVELGFPSLLRGARWASLAAGFLLFAGCQTPEPVRVDANFVAAPALTAQSPAVVAVLPIEDGTGGTALDERLRTYIRQQIERQLVDRKYSPLRSGFVDAAGAVPAGESVLTPATLAKVAGRAGEDAVLAVRVGRWDESTLLKDRRLRFQFEAVMIGRDGAEPLWSGSIQGEVKAGGAGAAPLGRDPAARSCADLAVHELLLRLPSRIVN